MKFDYNYKGIKRLNNRQLKNDYYNWLSCTDNLSTDSSMKRYMKQHKINFFESPHPHSFNPFPHAHMAEPIHQLIDFHEEPLFYSPLKASPQPHHESSIFYHIQASTQSPQFKEREENLLQNYESILDQESDYATPPAINQKIEFSEEEPEQLFLPLTPEKPIYGYYNNLDNHTTVRKKINTSTSTTISDPRLCQRGLKKLAYQAFIFVSNQRRTTYKDVAKKLITQMNDDGQSEPEKKGEMNVKRRVYDALNVLIALGLLKRSGNKIIGKRSQDQLNSSSPLQDGRRDLRLDIKDEELEEQRQCLRRIMRQKEKTITQKKKMIEALRKKIASVRELQEKNKSSSSLKTDRIQLPFVVLCSNPNSSLLDTQDRDLGFVQEKEELLVTFPTNSIQILGDLDVVSSIQRPFLPEKVERTRRRRRN